MTKKLTIFSENEEILEKIRNHIKLKFENVVSRISDANTYNVGKNKRLCFLKILIANRKENVSSMETLFRSARSKGYNMRRKTFTRDISYLESINFVRLERTFNKGNRMMVYIV